MGRILVQRGHCFRRSGATGTHREQEFASAIGTRLVGRLRELGHDATLHNADDDLPDRGDAFIALHCDGSANPARRGASVGYPDARGRILAHAWRDAHLRAGYPGPVLPDNYTTGLSRYYGYRRTACTYEFLAEHGTTTNRADELWIQDNLDGIVEAHVSAVGKVLGHPSGGGARVLGRGDSGEDVRALQTRLRDAFGYQLDVDGKFGPATDAAVRDFQRRNDLLDDGLVGEQTRAALEETDRDAWVIGAIRERWLGLRADGVDLGGPLTRELRCPDGRGRYNHFERGSIYWTPEGGAWAVRGDLRAGWESYGWEAGRLGYPTADERPATAEDPGTADGERVQTFERGWLIWNPSRKVRAVLEVWSA